VIRETPKGALSSSWEPKGKMMMIMKEKVKKIYPITI
jgi:hypothetical protein